MMLVLAFLLGASGLVIDRRGGARRPAALHAKKRRLDEIAKLQTSSSDTTNEWAGRITTRLDAAAALADVELVEKDLAAECAEASRDLVKVDALVAKLEALDCSLRLGGDWKLLWAKSDEGLGELGTGLWRVPLARLEDIFVSFDSGNRVRTTEIIRVIGPFPNVKNSMRGTWTSKKGRLEMTYTKVVEGLGKELTGNKRSVEVRVASASDSFLVLEAAAVGAKEWLVFQRTRDLAGDLRAMRVVPNEETY